MLNSTSNKLNSVLINEDIINNLPNTSSFAESLNNYDLSLKLLEDSDYLETNSFVSFGNDGSLLFLQVVVASFKPMFSYQPGIHAKYISPSGEITVFSQKYEKSDLQLSSCQLSGSICESNWTRFEEGETHGFNFIFAAKDAKKKYKFSANLVFRGKNGSATKFGTGKVTFDSNEKEFISMVYPSARVNVTGNFTIGNDELQNFDGIGYLGHYLHNIKPHRYVNRWDLIKLHSLTEGSLTMTVMTTTKLFDYRKIAHGFWMGADGTRLAVTLNNSVEILQTSYDSDSGYQIPAAVKFIWKGFIDHNSLPFEAQLIFECNRMIHKFDILDSIPYFIRVIIKAFVAKPFHFQWFERMSATIKIGDPNNPESIQTLNGFGLYETTILNQ
eukprot:TRINITY_DN592_c2_g1_i1.p1 TRINITY_DN592_c2_g1~~TRINITY_DN592_c2_g1_i1.p1  ORF type:complete len:386 (-),score=167.57 TRINITY_DN592_c2_g1_i1:31-1188(-)